MNRIEKVKLLQGLLNGSVTLQSLKPKRLSMKIGYGPTHFLINDKEVREEIHHNEVIEQLKRGVRFVFKIRYGNRVIN
ncbi:MAG: hypothetical protein JWQ09_2985 [Segetibacter sp.]|nr:hypothetical protein [Segetibacter sp.]